MTDVQAIKRLQAYLYGHPAGAMLDTQQVANLLSACWNGLDKGGIAKMRAEKLGRIEQPTWSPPFLEFSMERHGQTANDLTRATLCRWRVDVEKGTAQIFGEKRRKLHATDEPLKLE